MKENTINNSKLYTDVCSIIEQGKERAYSAVSQQMIETYWHIGQRIVEEEQQGKERAEYGEHIIEKLSEQLTYRYGKGFSKRYLAYFRQFYLTINDIQILQTRLQNLTWSHIHRVLSLEDPVAIRWYLESASAEMWSVRTLDRNIATQYYERHFIQPSLPMSESEPNKYELLKNPVVAEFLGFKEDASFSEEELESAIISHLQDFLMEMGRGFAFMGRQQLIRTSVLSFALRQAKTLLDTLSSKEMSNYLLPNTRLSSPQRNSFALRLNVKNNSSCSSKRIKTRRTEH